MIYECPNDASSICVVQLVHTLIALPDTLHYISSTQQVNDHRDPTAQIPDLCKRRPRNAAPNNLLPNVVDPPRC